MKYFFLLIFLVAQTSYSQNIEPFTIFNKKGKKVTVKRFLKELETDQIILFGEHHDNPISHWLELKVTKHLNEKNKITLGAEMFESNQQDALDDYLNGKLDQKGLDSTITLWINYKTDYKPLVDYAKEQQLSFVATNIPRKYASYVYRNGFKALEDTLTTEERKLVAPLPIEYDPELPGYKAMLTMMGHTPNPNFPKAQAIKDATMAYFIYEHFKQNNTQFLHFNGAYHSNNYEGIYWYLKKLDEQLAIKTISTVQQANPKVIEDKNKGIADYIIVVDEEMTKTH